MALGDALFDLAGRTASGNSTALDAVSNGLDRLAKAAGTAMESVSRLTESLVKLLVAPLDHVKGLANVIGPLVAAFNPGVVQQFALALHDTSAVVGSMLLPVMQGLTVYTRKFGDTLAGMIPVIAPLTEKIGQFIADFGTGFTKVIAAAAPVVQVLSDALGWLLDKLTIGIGLFAGAVTELLNLLTSALGLTSRFNPDAQSTGFGTRQTRVESVQQASDDVFASSARNIYSRDSGVKSPQQASEELAKSFEQGRQAIRDLTTKLTEAKEWLENHAPHIPTAHQIEFAVKRGALAVWRSIQHRGPLGGS
jgi:hypothetical protein